MEGLQKTQKELSENQRNDGGGGEERGVCVCVCLCECVYTGVLGLAERERRSEAWSTPPSSLPVTTLGLASLLVCTPVGHLDFM